MLGHTTHDLTRIEPCTDVHQKQLELNALKNRTFNHGITKKSKKDLEREAAERKAKEEEEWVYTCTHICGVWIGLGTDTAEHSPRSTPSLRLSKASRRIMDTTLKLEDRGRWGGCGGWEAGSCVLVVRQVTNTLSS
jgi:hypothetical protein